MLVARCMDLYLVSQKYAKFLYLFEKPGFSKQIRFWVIPSKQVRFFNLSLGLHTSGRLKGNY